MNNKNLKHYPTLKDVDENIIVNNN